MVRESKAPHSSPTFCVRKQNGKWQNKYTAATIPVLTLIFEDLLQNNMVRFTVLGAFESVDDYYQLLMRAATFRLLRSALQAVCFGGGWWCHKGCLTQMRRGDAVIRPHREFARHTLMIFLSTAVRSMESLMWKVIQHISERCSSACASISCRLILINVSLERMKSLFVGATLEAWLRADFKAIIDWPNSRN